MTLYDRNDLDVRRSWSGDIWTTLKTSITRWRADRAARSARRTAIVQMAEMPDWQLRDIGINRGDVDRLMARHGVALDRVKDDFRH